MYKGKNLNLLSTFALVDTTSATTPYRMRGLVSSLVLILALSRKVVFGAPKDAAVNVPEGASISSLNDDGCKIHGTCSILTRATCCSGVCILTSAVTVSQDAHHLIIS